MVSEQSRHLLRNNVPEVLRLALREPVTVVKDGQQIACVVSVAAFTDAGGDVTRLRVDAWSERARSVHEFGEGARHDRVQRFGRMILHAAHSKSFAPVLVNGQIVAVVIPPLSDDRSALPFGVWLSLDTELIMRPEKRAKR
jgi:hypothetical protein